MEKYLIIISSRLNILSLPLIIIILFSLYESNTYLGTRKTKLTNIIIISSGLKYLSLLLLFYFL